MYRTICLLALAALGGLTLGQARSERLVPNKDALALQEAFQEAIAEAEPSIACILVSRSPRYHDKEFNKDNEIKAAPSTENPGQLGSFHYDYKRLEGLDQATYKARKRQILRLDLASGGTAPESFGSGVVIDEKDRLILTNYHVVLKATKLYVRLPGGKGSYANIFAADPRSDLAVLQLIDNVDLKAIKLGDGEKVKKGQFVLTIANPYAAGFRDGSPSASWGILSNLRRLAPNSWRNELDNTKTLHNYGTLLQTDCRIGLGCSGGALIDLHGRLIGLTTALAAVNGTDTPGGFAVPVDATMRRVIETLKQGKEVEYSFLGVQFRNPLTSKGVVLEDVVTNSPAFFSLKGGDTIVSLNGTRVNEIDDVVLPLGRLTPGSTARVEIVRDSITKTQNIVVAKFAVQGPIIASNRPEFRGIRVDYTSLLVQPPLADQFSPRPRIPKGVFVCAIKPDSPGAKTALKIRDVVTAVNGVVVNSPPRFYEEVRKHKGLVELTIQNGSKVTDATKVKIEN